jgi:hypothetical protein
MAAMTSSLFAAFLLIAVPGAEPAANAFESTAELKPAGKIDELVFARLKQLGIEPARLCSDQVFVRRVYLDVIGTLPTPDEVREFLASQDPEKRRALIDRLLERDEYADYWAMKWSDLLRIKAEFPINLWPHAAQSYHRWVRTCIQANLPYDQFARELLTANGSNFRVPQVNFYRAIQGREPKVIAQAVALTFMGCRADKWPAERLMGMAGFFSQITYKSTAEWKEEIVFYDPSKAAAKALDAAAKAAPQGAVFPDGTAVSLSTERDPRTQFAEWLIAPDNPWFTRNIANRVWSWLVGRGIIHEPDDMRPDNPPSNPELLAYLEQELQRARYDLKSLYRLILNSKTYQLSSVGRSDKPEALANFARYPLRRLDAEVLIDALCQITGTTERYSSIVPEPYTYIPENTRSIALPDGSITSAFLEQFGRPARDTGLEAERINKLTANQRLHLLNSSHIRQKIQQSPRLKELMKSDKEPREIVSEIYLLILSRAPTEEELKTPGVTPPERRPDRRNERGKDRNKDRNKDQAKGQAKDRSKERVVKKDLPVPVDLVWALVNSSEFLYRH